MTLKEIVEKSRARDKAVTPGLHAQLGLLYSKTGNNGQALAEFNTDKTLFPESAPFMNFLGPKIKGVPNETRISFLQRCCRPAGERLR